MLLAIGHVATTPLAASWDSHHRLNSPFAPNSMAGSKRLLWIIAISVTVLLLFFARPSSFNLPSSFSLSRHSEDQGSLLTSGSISSKMSGGRMRVQEIHGLLHLVAQTNGHLTNEVAGDNELDLKVYADAAGGEDDWQNYVKRLYAETPVVVFSKVRHYLDKTSISY